MVSSNGFNPEWIWGDDAETTVYAQGYSDAGQTQLGGKGCATRVRIRGDPDKGLFVFKGIDFRTFLAHTDDEDGGDQTVRYLIRCWHRADKLLLRIPPHPNIMPPPTTFVTISFGNNPPVVCGSLQPLYPGGNVGERLEKSNRKGERLPP
ncbi:hypothetical protein C8A03DRAFT_28976 [Achaetomium macrosporum]|uniref:Uncharacterized protein n=1 Tax=Achaetomium macrosporum TaxID=79813 RepID=A0AAN7HAL4_9PEZI|nr:hypothetical protein C8A03DRAFT_28976 [Achaetomium macrosporum]